MNQSHGTILTVAMGHLDFFLSFLLSFSSQLYIRSLTLDSWPTLSSIHTDDCLTRQKGPKSQCCRESSRWMWKQLRWRLHRDQRFFHPGGGSNGHLIIEISQLGTGISEDDQSPDPGRNSGNECSAGPQNHTPFSVSGRFMEWYLASTLTEHVTAPLLGRDWVIPANQSWA